MPSVSFHMKIPLCKTWHASRKLFLFIWSFLYTKLGMQADWGKAKAKNARIYRFSSHCEVCNHLRNSCSISILFIEPKVKHQNMLVRLQKVEDVTAIQICTHSTQVIITAFLWWSYHLLTIHILHIAFRQIDTMGDNSGIREYSWLKTQCFANCNPKCTNLIPILLKSLLFQSLRKSR